MKNFYQNVNKFYNKIVKQIYYKIIALTLVFIILGCETPAGFNAENSTEPAATIFDFNTDGPGSSYTNSGENSENKDIFIPSVSANSTSLSVDWSTTIPTAISTALNGAFISGAMWKTTDIMRYTMQNANNRNIFNGYGSVTRIGAIGGAMVAVSGLIIIANIFAPDKAAETARKLDAISTELTKVEDSIKTIQDEWLDAVVQVEDDITAKSIGDYLNQISTAIKSARYRDGNALSLSKAELTFKAVDGEITTGEEAAYNNAKTYANVCRGLFSTPNPYIDPEIKENLNLYNAYITLGNLIIGTKNYWTNGLSACDAYTTYLSKICNYNTQTFEKRQAFIDALANTYTVLTNYLLRALLFDMDFNVELYDTSMDILDTMNSTDPLYETINNIAATAYKNIIYVDNVLLDPTAKDKGSITYLNAKVSDFLVTAQKSLQKEEAIAKFPITGETLNPQGITTYAQTISSSYEPLIYSYRLKRYLKKDLVEVPAEQYVRYNMGTDYNIEAKWEGNNFRNPSPSQQTALNNKLSERDMNSLKDTAYYRDINIIDDLTKAGFMFNFSLKDSGSSSRNTFYILGMGGSEATNSPGNYRKIFEKAIVWGAYKQGPQLNSAWTPDGEENVFFDKKIVWKILAINYYDKKTSSTAYSSHGNIPTPDPCVLVYGDSGTIPNIISVN